MCDRRFRKTDSNVDPGARSRIGIVQSASTGTCSAQVRNSGLLLGKNHEKEDLISSQLILCFQHF